MQVDRLLTQPPASSSFYICMQVERLLTQATTLLFFNMFELNEATSGHPLSTLAFFLIMQIGSIDGWDMDMIKLAWCATAGWRYATAGWWHTTARWWYATAGGRYAAAGWRYATAGWWYATARWRCATAGRGYATSGGGRGRRPSCLLSPDLSSLLASPFIYSLCFHP